MPGQIPPRLTRRALLAGLGGAALSACTGTSALTVDSAASSTTPPAGPRVVTLGTAALDSAMTLGITPVGAALNPADGSLPDYWPVSRVAEITPVGDIGLPDTAVVRRLRPDLIIGEQAVDGAHYETLSRIAPTLLTTSAGQAWKTAFQQHAQALGRRAAADAFTTAYQRHAGQVAQALAAAGLTGRRISVVRFTAGGPPRLYGRQSFPGTLLADVQLGRPDSQGADQAETDLGADQLARADGDFILYGVAANTPAPASTPSALTGTDDTDSADSTDGGDGTDGASGGVPASAGWRALAAVRAHRAFPVSDQLWFQGVGYTGANAVLDELQHLLGA